MSKKPTGKKPKNTINESKRISEDNYKKPLDGTRREKMDREDILQQLENYEAVTDIDDVPINTHVRYIAYRNGKQQYYPGGLIKVKGNEYVVLTNALPRNYRNPITWSVQKENFDKSGKSIKTHFFRRITPDEIKIQKNASNQKEVIKSQNELIERQQRELIKLKKFIKSLNL